MTNTLKAILNLRPNSSFSYDEKNGLKWLDEEQVEPTQDEIDVEIIKIINEDKIQDIKNNFIKNEPLLIPVTLFNGTTKSITFDTKSDSAIAIETSIKLSQDLNEASTKIWDVNNVVYEFTISEATRIKNIIAVSYRDRILERQRLISEVVI